MQDKVDGGKGEDEPTQETAFDQDDWMSRLLALNAWAQDFDLTQDDVSDDEVFVKARKAACLKRWQSGKDDWNAWAERMLALKAEAEAAGAWQVKFQSGTNNVTRAWLNVATVDFSDHEFDADADFSRHLFPSSTVFVRAQFGGHVWFDDAKFTEDAVFNNAHFCGVTEFSRTKFGREVQFVNAEFSGGEVWFADTEFRGGNVRFQSAQFRDGEAWFGGAKFDYGDVWFSHAEFHNKVWFCDAQFSGGIVQFDGVQFTKGSDFDHVQFHFLAQFNQAEFDGPVTFRRAIFQDAAVFASAQSKVAFSLAEAHFRRAPDFIEASFHEPPRLDDAIIEDPMKRRPFGDDTDPRPRPFLFWRGFKLAADGQVHARYRKLRKMAGEGKDHENEIRFNAREIASQRFWVHQPMSWRGGAGRFWISWIYGLVSNYGQSLARPLATWAVLLAVFTLIYGAISGAPDKDAIVSGAPSAANTTTSPKTSVETTDAVSAPAKVKPAAKKESTKSWGSRLTRTCHSSYLAALEETTNGAVMTGPPTSPIYEALNLSLRNSLIFIRADASPHMYRCLYGVHTIGGKQYPFIPFWVIAVSMLQSLLSVILLFLIGLALRNMYRVR